MNIFNFLLTAPINIPGFSENNTDVLSQGLYKVLKVSEYVMWGLAVASAIIAMIIISVSAFQTMTSANKEGVWQNLASKFKIVLISLGIICGASILVGIVLYIYSTVGIMPSTPEGITCVELLRTFIKF